MKVVEVERGLLEEGLPPEEVLRLCHADWHGLQKRSLEFGYCLYDPPEEWALPGMKAASLDAIQQQAGRIQLPTGSFSAQDLLAILDTLPVDITFVGSDDRVKYFHRRQVRQQ